MSGVEVSGAESQYVSPFTLKISDEVKKAPTASIIVPVYNEVDIISPNLLYLSSCVGLDYELIVCDDCSTDGTGDALSSVIKRVSNIRLLRFDKRMGKGASIKKAVELANGELIVFVDADLSANLEDLPKLLMMASRRDALIISRRTLRARLTQGVLRLMLSLGYNFVVRLVFRTGVRDHQCGFKAMSKKVASKLMSQTMSNRFVFDTELIVLAKKLGVPVEEVQIGWIDRRPRSANIKWVRIAIQMMKDLLLFNRNLHRTSNS